MSAIGSIAFSNLSVTLPVAQSYSCAISNAGQPSEGYTYVNGPTATAVRSYAAPTCNGPSIDFGSLSMSVSADALQNDNALAAAVNIVTVSGYGMQSGTIGISGTYAISGSTANRLPLFGETVDLTYRFSISLYDFVNRNWNFYAVPPNNWLFRLADGDVFSATGTFPLTFTVPVGSGQYALQITEYVALQASGSYVDEPGVLALLAVAVAIAAMCGRHRA